MKHMSVAEAGELAELVHQVAHDHERIAINQDGEPVAFLISASDFNLLEGLEEEEERLDTEAIRKAIQETGSIPWEKIKKNQGL
ncbi:MAG: type II toxin-antitoxin system Phd/YefM family antitoxin [Magnetococcales bacterium]|nr:type II toxin-antitoxin system Phd/YefM family antitoxin [Magnetococcales bacterium]